MGGMGGLGGVGWGGWPEIRHSACNGSEIQLFVL